ncbi:MAG: dTDP-4-dehydrorhamnose reductase [Luteitalea sp.]|nr:dTDP-4-dehydrorhamnose reductase [Luteitalea sp.]
MRVAVIGARGQLGAAIVHQFGASHSVVPFDHSALEITDAAAVDASLSRASPDVIVNCAAYNAVDAAEADPVAALEINALGVRTLARWAGGHGAALVHYSTDFVFDGTATRPYSETDTPNPRSVYAASKLIGEWFALDAPRGYVLRVESLFGRAPDGPPAKGSVASIIAALRSGAVARVFVDRTVSPTSVIDAASATRELVEGAFSPGLFHCVNTGACTWLELAEYAAELLGVVPRLDPVKVADVALPAPRPQYCALSNDKLRALGINMPTWQESLQRHLAGLDRGDARKSPRHER